MKVQEGTGVGHRGLDFLAVAHDPGVLQQSADPFPVVGRHALRIEPFEHFQESLPLAQDDRPAQPRLEAVEDELCEQLFVAMQRHTPFPVVILLHEWIAVRPAATSCHGVVNITPGSLTSGATGCVTDCSRPEA